MQENFLKAVSDFLNSNLEGIRRYAGWFAKSITLGIIKEDKQELEDLCASAQELRADINYADPINKNKEYFLGYCAAYENIAGKFIDYASDQDSIKLVIETLPNLRMSKIINYLGNKGLAQQNEIAAHLNIKPSHLSNILNNPSVKQINILNVRKVGKHAIYSLNKKGKDYYKSQLSDEKIQYTKKQVLELISSIMNNYEYNNIEEIIDKASIVDEDFIKSIYNEVYKLNIKKEIIKTDMYFNMNYRLLEEKINFVPSYIKQYESFGRAICVNKDDKSKPIAVA